MYYQAQNQYRSNCFLLQSAGWDCFPIHGHSCEQFLLMASELWTQSCSSCTSSVQHHKSCRSFHQTTDASGHSQKEWCPPVSSLGKPRVHGALLRKGKFLTEGSQGWPQGSSPSPTEGSKPHRCPWAGLSLWAIKKQTLWHTTYFAYSLHTPTHYLHASPYSARFLCCCASKAPKSLFCTTKST